MKVIRDKNTCISCGNCVAICSAVFGFNQEGRVEVLKESVKDENLRKCVKEAADICPVKAISYED